MIKKIINSLLKGYFLLELYERLIFFVTYTLGLICKYFYKIIFNKRLIFGKILSVMEILMLEFIKIQI